jgi:hypothetical protein
VEGDRIEFPYLTVLPLASLTAFLRGRPAALSGARLRRAVEVLEARTASKREPPIDRQARTATT